MWPKLSQRTKNEDRKASLSDRTGQPIEQASLSDRTGQPTGQASRSNRPAYRTGQASLPSFPSSLPINTPHSPPTHLLSLLLLDQKFQPLYLSISRDSCKFSTQILYFLDLYAFLHLSIFQIPTFNREINGFEVF